jgi:hypothetical protein
MEALHKMVRVYEDKAAALLEKRENLADLDEISLRVAWAEANAELMATLRFVGHLKQLKTALEGGRDG